MALTQRPWPECPSWKLSKYQAWLNENKKRAGRGWRPLPLPPFLKPCAEGPPQEPEEPKTTTVQPAPPKKEIIKVLDGGQAATTTQAATDGGGGDLWSFLQELGPWAWAGIGVGAFLLLLVVFFFGRETV